MSAVVQFALEKGAVELREVAVPDDPAEDEVILAARAVGICGSEIHQYLNTHSWPVRVPVILGHEFSGVVARAGRAAGGFREGDRVTSETAARVCGRCACCRSGDYNLCPERLGFGYGVDGGMADYVKVPARCLHRLPENVSFEKAALIEPCSVVYNAVCEKTALRAGDAVLVLGPGPIGLLAAMMARLAGAGSVVVAGLERDAARLAVARKLGADRTINLERENFLEAIREISNGLGADAVIEATGASAALKQALEAVRPGGQITKVGWGPEPLGFSLDPLVRKAVRLQGSFSHNFPIWEKVIALMASGRLDPTPLVGRVEPLSAWRNCFDAMAGGEVVKAVLKPGAGV